MKLKKKSAETSVFSPRPTYVLNQTSVHLAFLIKTCEENTSISSESISNNM